MPSDEINTLYANTRGSKRPSQITEIQVQKQNISTGNSANIDWKAWRARYI
jgi:hypothetical protein